MQYGNRVIPGLVTFRWNHPSAASPEIKKNAINIRHFSEKNVKFSLKVWPQKKLAYN